MEKDWKEVFITNLDYQAAMAKDILESAGLNVVVMNQHDSTYATFGNIIVYVPDNEAEQALELLKELKD
jgi:hypothetical protein